MHLIAIVASFTGFDNLIPRVLSQPGESTLVTAGYVSARF